MFVDLFTKRYDWDTKEFPVNTIECRDSQDVAEVVKSVVDHMPGNGIVKIVVHNTTDGQSPMSAFHFLGKNFDANQLQDDHDYNR